MKDLLLTLIQFVDIENGISSDTVMSTYAVDLDWMTLKDQCCCFQSTRGTIYFEVVIIHDV